MKSVKSWNWGDCETAECSFEGELIDVGGVNRCAECLQAMLERGEVGIREGVYYYVQDELDEEESSKW